MTEKYKNPALTTDIAVFSIMDKTLKVLLIKRKDPPFKDKWAIPGGFVNYDEEIETAAIRELEEETGIKNVHLEQIHTFGKVGRDPRGRTISVLYLVLVNAANIKVEANSDAKEAKWFNIKDLPELAFDHADLMIFAIKTLKQKLENTTLSE